MGEGSWCSALWRNGSVLCAAVEALRSLLLAHVVNERTHSEQTRDGNYAALGRYSLTVGVCRDSSPSRHPLMQRQH